MATQNVNWPIESWAGLFSADPNDPNQNQTWSGLSDRVLGFRSQYGTQYELGTVETGDCDIALLNKDEYLNPANTSSPFNSGSNLLVPYRRVMGTATWPNGAGGSATGNLLNATNATQWGQSTDTSTFEGGGVGEWAAIGTTPPTVANSATRAQQGSKSMVITWPTASNGGAPTVSRVWAPFQGPFKIGQTYTLSLYLWAAAGVPKMRVAFNSSSVFATSATFASAWQRVTVTWTADAVWSNFQIFPDANTTSGQQVWVDAVQVDIGSAASTYATTGPTVYPLFAGFIERYPLSWTKAGYLGQANLTCVDANALLARTEFLDVLSEDIEQDSPRVTFKLDDAAGTTRPAVAAWAMTKAISGGMFQIGTGGPAPTYGNQSSPSIDGGACLVFAPTDPSNFTVVSLGWTVSLASPTSQTVEFWFNRATLPSANEVILSGLKSGSAPLEIGVDSQGRVFAREVNNYATPTFYYSINGPNNSCDATWHHVAWTQSGTTSRTTNLYVDGRLVATTSTTPPGGTSFRPQYVYLGGHFGTVSTSPFAGSLAWVSIYDGNLSAGRLLDHWAAAATGHDRDLPGVRLRRALTWAGWNGPQSIPDGYTPVGPASALAGRTVADVGRDMATAEAGWALCQPDGDLTLVTRDSVNVKTTSTVTLGENTAGGEIPYKGDIAFDMDPQFVYNRVEVTGYGGLTNGPTSDTTSQSRYFLSTLSLSTVIATADDLAGYQQNLLARYKDAHVRVQTVTIDPAVNPSAWPTALGIKFGDRVTVKRRTATFTMSADFIVVQKSHETAPGKWQTRLQLVPVQPTQAWILGDATYGVLGSTTAPTY